jgi:sporulation protein YlmC with PRC-barrel domain
MKRSILRAYALCLTTAFVAGTACAQDTDKPISSQSRPDSSTLTSQGGPGASSAVYGSAATRGQPARLSKLMNTSLRGQTGESLGQVQDLVIDPTSGQIQFVVLSLDSTASGAIGARTTTTSDSSVSSPRTSPSGVGSYGTPTGGRLVALPWRLISSTGSDQYTATVDRTKLQSAPTFSSTSWPTMDSAWSQRVYSHFGVDATSRGAPGSDTSTGTGTGIGTGTGTGTGTGIGNPSTPGVPSTPGTPDITPPTPGTSPTPSTPGTVPNASGSGTGK